MRIALHLAVMALLIGLAELCVFYPLLPGQYDGLAMAVSMMAQTAGALGCLLAPLGIVWIAYERLSSRKRWRRGLGLLALLLLVLLASAVTLVAVMMSGAVLGMLTIVLLAGAGLSGFRWRRGKDGGPAVAPYYLAAVAPGIVALQIPFMDEVTALGRRHAIEQSAELIEAIEKHHTDFGSYPPSMGGVWPDYKPGVVGIERYRYARSGEAYNLFFELPTFLIGNFGTREIVVYNPRDEHVIPSHASWVLIWPFEKLKRHQGWYAAHEGPAPHWKYFWFD
ncbi:MAG: hypothetical protein AMXMBFR84_32940 [Candidatus Hydrogenedentota bacterium]